MQSIMRKAASLALLPLLITVSACETTVSREPIFPSRAAVAQLQEDKPPPTVDIVTDAQASERYNAEVEGWGDRLSAAGRRMCAWFNDNGGDFDCEPPPADPPD